ncbi:MAG TPA: hypothetical protein VN851_08930 [Thermoanaerobaculia bacterium]|nr:hypothetical protein [Thermoanaerobaculia bacterium]
MNPRIAGFAVAFVFSALAAFAADPNLEAATIPAGFSAPRLVRDINPVPGNLGSEPHDFVKVGERSVFVAGGEGGNELYATDGTAAGTGRLADLCPGPCGTEPIRFAETPGFYFFTRYPHPVSQPGRRELWATDGTAAGTRRVAQGIDTDASNLDDRLWVANAGSGGRLYFVWNEGTSGSELWSSDGTATGTKRVADLRPGGEGSTPRSFAVWRNRFYFAADDGRRGPALYSVAIRGAADLRFVADPAGQRAVWPYSLRALDRKFTFVLAGGPAGILWSSDGRPEGTKILLALDETTSAGFSNGNAGLPIFRDRLLFIARRGEAGPSLWSTDGTFSGTLRLRRFAAINGLALLSAQTFKDRLYFSAASGSYGAEPWSTDGTRAGTRLFADLCAGPCGSHPGFGVAAGGRMFFDATSQAGQRSIWSTDGTTEGTQSATAGLCSGSCRFRYLWVGATASRLVFALYSLPREGELRLYATDGTEEGTEALGDGTTPLVWDAILHGIPVGDELVFSAYDEAHGVELWTTDGTDAGTRLLSDVGDADSGGSFPGPPVALGDQAIFIADGGHGEAELWASDGTRNGTERLAGLGVPVGRQGIDVPQITGHAQADQRALLLISFSSNLPTQLWSTDGTAAGTYELPGLNPVYNEIATLGGRVLFLATDENGYQRLASTDGTPGGTETVADLWRSSFGPEHLASFGDKVVFSAFGLASGVEPWVTDGTLAGTHPFADLRPGEGYLSSSFPRGFVEFENRLWFFAGSEGEFGRANEVWRTDGTPEGTERVFAFDPEDFYVNRLIPTAGRLFVVVDGFYEQRLFAYDAAEGMIELGLWHAISFLPYFVEDDTVVGDRLFFASPDDSGELWISDGTRAGTRTIPRPDGARRGLEHGLQDFGGYVFFSAGTRPSEKALWATDGTKAGTFQIVRNATGWIRAIGSHLFFTRWTPGLGFELWAIDRLTP